MAASLEYCVRIIEDLERRIAELELSASRKTPVAPPSPQHIHRPEISETVLKCDAIYPVLRFEAASRKPERNDVWQERRLTQGLP